MKILYCILKIVLFSFSFLPFTVSYSLGRRANATPTISQCCYFGGILICVSLLCYATLSFRCTHFWLHFPIQHGRNEDVMMFSDLPDIFAQQWTVAPQLSFFFFFLLLFH